MIEKIGFSKKTKYLIYSKIKIKNKINFFLAKNKNI